MLDGPQGGEVKTHTTRRADLIFVGLRLMGYSHFARIVSAKRSCRRNYRQATCKHINKSSLSRHGVIRYRAVSVKLLVTYATGSPTAFPQSDPDGAVKQSP